MKEASEEEKKEREAHRKTQGRKGCHSPRINIAYSTENYNFIKDTAMAMGITLSDCCNLIVETYRNDHPELMQAIKAARAAGAYRDSEEE